jgi:hypothetical protein
MSPDEGAVQGAGEPERHAEILTDRCASVRPDIEHLVDRDVVRFTRPW